MRGTLILLILGTCVVAVLWLAVPVNAESCQLKPFDVSCHGICPVLKTDWETNVVHWNCTGSTTYHCGRDVDTKDLTEGCAEPVFCGRGKEPRLRGVSGKIKKVICTNCDDKKYNPYNWSSDSIGFSQCPYLRTVCHEDEGLTGCDNVTGINMTWTDSKCTCDARKGFVPSYIDLAHVCSSDITCVPSTCDRGEELLQSNFSCTSVCKKGYQRMGLLDDCVPLTTAQTEVVKVTSVKFQTLPSTTYPHITKSSSKRPPMINKTSSPDHEEDKNSSSSLKIGYIVLFVAVGIIIGVLSTVGIWFFLREQDTRDKCLSVLCWPRRICQRSLGATGEDQELELRERPVREEERHNGGIGGRGREGEGERTLRYDQSAPLALPEEELLLPVQEQDPQKRDEERGAVGGTEERRAGEIGGNFGLHVREEGREGVGPSVRRGADRYLAGEDRTLEKEATERVLNKSKKTFKERMTYRDAQELVEALEAKNMFSGKIQDLKAMAHYQLPSQTVDEIFRLVGNRLKYQEFKQVLKDAGLHSLHLTLISVEEEVLGNNERQENLTDMAHLNDLTEPESITDNTRV